MNLNAFLATIGESEGTVPVPGGENGYRVLVGSTIKEPKLFYDYADHPRILVTIRKGLSSTAAGRYQILARYFDHYKKSLGLPDFSPDSQDRIAIQMIREQKALDHVVQGKFDLAVAEVSNIWASFPGAGYGQHEWPLDKLRGWFLKHGGVIT
jgi:muramidase (phage lysozyme)